MGSVDQRCVVICGQFIIVQTYFTAMVICFLEIIQLIIKHISCVIMIVFWQNCNTRGSIFSWLVA